MTNARRILALDGGGVRGIISVEILTRIESLLRERLGRPELRLADWFDFMAGTSTGAITAALLATGHSVAEVRAFYEDHARELFRPVRFSKRAFYRYDAGFLAHRLREIFGPETTLGSERIRTLLLLVMRNATTDSPWFLTNIPCAKFNDREFPGCNLDLPLWQLIRASAAAPTYFAPEVIDIGSETYIFADGALTGYNNPAFKAFLIATVEPFCLCWPTGPDRMLLVSVGTGSPSEAEPSLSPRRMHKLYHAQTLPEALLSSTRHQQDLLCRAFGDCLVGDPLDLEVGDLIGARGPVDPKLFTYLRYDVPLTEEGLAGVGCSHLDPARLSRLDDVDCLEELSEAGAAAAARRVRPEHFDRFLAPG